MQQTTKGGVLRGGRCSATRCCWCRNECSTAPARQTQLILVRFESMPTMRAMPRTIPSGFVFEAGDPDIASGALKCTSPGGLDHHHRLQLLACMFPFWTHPLSRHLLPGMPGKLVSSSLLVLSTPAPVLGIAIPCTPGEGLYVPLRPCLPNFSAVLSSILLSLASRGVPPTLVKVLAPHRETTTARDGCRDSVSAYQHQQCRKSMKRRNSPHASSPAFAAVWITPFERLQVGANTTEVAFFVFLFRNVSTTGDVGDPQSSRRRRPTGRPHILMAGRRAPTPSQRQRPGSAPRPRSASQT